MFGASWRFVGAAVVLAVALAGILATGAVYADEVETWSASDMEAHGWDADEFATMDGEYSLVYGSGAAAGHGECVAVAAAGDYTMTFHAQDSTAAASVGAEFFDDGSCGDSVGTADVDVAAGASWADYATSPFTLDSGWSFRLRYTAALGDADPLWISSASVDLAADPSPSPSDSAAPMGSVEPSASPSAAPSPSAGVSGGTLACPSAEPCYVVLDQSGMDALNAQTFAVVVVGCLTVFSVGVLMVASVRR